MDNVEKLLILSMVFVVILAVFGIVRFDQRVEDCASKNGILVKTSDGWKCVNRDIFK